MTLKSKIKSKCNSLNLDTVGFTKCRRFDELYDFFKEKKEKNLLNEFEELDIEKKINPLLLMKEGKTIISIAFPYEASQGKCHGEIYFSKYTQTLDYHKVVHSYLNEIVTYIQELGGKAEAFVDSNPLPERYIAMLSGVGFIGKNNMVITEKYGSYVFLGEIITDLELEEDSPGENKCDNCDKCIKHCPTKAIKLMGENKKGVSNNSNICLSYLTQKKDLEEFWMDKLNGRIFGCDTCQDVCPYNENRDVFLERFKCIPYMKNFDLKELTTLDNKTFKEKYKNSSCGWRGKNILMRNAIIAAYYKNSNYTLEEKEFNSPYLKEYIKLLKNKKE